MSAPYTGWSTGAKYSFTTIAPTILQANYTSVKLAASSINFDIAVKVGSINLLAQWRQVYPLLPEGTPDTPDAVNWMIFVMPDGQNVVLAEPWIDGASVTPVEFRQYDIAVTESNPAQMQRIRDFLNIIGARYQITERN